MMESFPNKSEQIKAILYSKVYDFALKYAGLDQSGRPQYFKVFNFTKKEFEDYLKKHYRLDNLPFLHLSPGKDDGIYAILKPDGYLIYYQERGMHDPRYEQILKTEEEVWKYYIKFTLDTSSTGIKWD
jgi:hypothetical protein